MTDTITISATRGPRKFSTRGRFPIIPLRQSQGHSSQNECVSNSSANNTSTSAGANSNTHTTQSCSLESTPRLSSFEFTLQTLAQRYHELDSHADEEIGRLREKNEELGADCEALEKESAYLRSCEEHRSRLHATTENNTVQTNEKKQQLDDSFIKEIIQDNSDMRRTMMLQMETLNRLQEEVDSLRNQLFELHTRGTHMVPQAGSRRTSQAESFARRSSLVTDSPHDKPPAVHVHHHYHGGASKLNGSLLGRSKSQGHLRGKKGNFATAAHTVQDVSEIRQAGQDRRLSGMLKDNTINPTPSTPLTALRIPSYTQPLKLNLKNTSVRCASSTSTSSTQKSPATTVSSNLSPPQSVIFEPRDPADTYDVSRPTSRGSSVAWQRNASSLLQGLELGGDLDYARMKGEDRRVHGKLASPLKLKTLRVAKRRLTAPDSIEDEDDFDRLQQRRGFSPIINLQQDSIQLSRDIQYDHGPIVFPIRYTDADMSISTSPKSVSRKPHTTLVTLHAKQALPDPPMQRSASVLINNTTSILARTSKTTHSKPLPPVMKSTQNNIQRSKNETYTPLTDTLGKRVGGWLSAKLSGSSTTTEKTTTGSRAASSSAIPQKLHNEKVPTRTPIRKEFRCDSMPIRPTCATIATTTITTTNNPVKAPMKAEASTQSNPEPQTGRPTTSHTEKKLPTPINDINDDDDKRLLLRAAGMDPISGLPALRNVSGMVMMDPRMSGEVDEEALRECLGEVEAD